MDAGSAGAGRFTDIYNVKHGFEGDLDTNITGIRITGR